MFGKGLITGLRVTLKHFFGEKSTFCYPEEKLPMTEHFRGGHLVLDYKKCIACTLCSLACPNQALDLKVKTDVNKKRHLEKYIHDMGRCLYCDLCVESCAPKALTWDKDYAISSWHKEDMVYDVMTEEDRLSLQQALAYAEANPKLPPVKAAPQAKPQAVDATAKTAPETIVPAQERAGAENVKNPNSTGGGDTV